MPEHLTHILTHSLTHSLTEMLKLLPFLYLTYLCMELLERRAGERAARLIARSGKAGPLFGALLGAVPQCGFSAALSSLYAGRLITSGTLLAVFWSTSDEMLPLLISSGRSAGTIAKIVAVKVLFALAAGFAVDALCRLWRRKAARAQDEPHIGELCQAEHCQCDHQALWLAALIHTLQIAAVVFVVGFVLHTGLELIGQEALGQFMQSIPVLSVLLTALIGLIPNCAASVAITQLYLGGVLSAGSMFAGLLAGAGVGLLVLFRVNRPVKDTLRLTAILFAVSALFGVLFDALSLGAWLGI